MNLPYLDCSSHRQRAGAWVICQKRGWVFHEGLQTQKTDKSTRLALSRCCEPMMKHEAVTFFLWYCIVSMSYVNQYNISFKCKCLTSDGWNLVVFIWRFLRYQDSSTWPKWSSFIGFCCMNNLWAWEFFINNSESDISRQTISCVKTPEKVILTIFHGL